MLSAPAVERPDALRKSFNSLTTECRYTEFTTEHVGVPQRRLLTMGGAVYTKTHLIGYSLPGLRSFSRNRRPLQGPVLYLTAELRDTKDRQAEHHYYRKRTTCKHRNRKTLHYFFMVKMASGMYRGRVRPTTIDDVAQHGEHTPLIPSLG